MPTSQFNLWGIKALGLQDLHSTYELLQKPDLSVPYTMEKREEIQQHLVNGIIQEMYNNVLFSYSP